jgi:hypothetical protein
MTEAEPPVQASPPPAKRSPWLLFAVAAPDTIGEFVPFDKSPRAASSVAQVRASDEQSSQRLSRSYRGAAAEEVRDFGAVSCTVRNDTTVRGQTPAPDSAHTGSCSRTEGEMTVEIRPAGDIAHQPDRVADLVNQLWTTAT